MVTFYFWDQLRPPRKLPFDSEKEKPRRGFLDSLMWMQQSCCSLAILDPGSTMKLVQQLFHPSQFKGTTSLLPSFEPSHWEACGFFWLSCAIIIYSTPGHFVGETLDPCLGCLSSMDVQRAWKLGLCWSFRWYFICSLCEWAWLTLSQIIK